MSREDQRATPDPPSPNGDPVPAARRGRRRWTESWAVRLGAPLLVLVLLGLFLRNLGYHEIARVVADAHPGWILVAVVLTLTGVGCRAIALRAFVAPVSTMSVGRALRYTFAGNTGNIVAPFRAGDGLRAWLLVRQQGLSLGHCAAVYFCEKMGDSGLVRSTRGSCAVASR